MEVIDEQVHLGIDVITDGELPRENYIHYFWYDLNNISQNKTKQK